MGWTFFESFVNIRPNIRNFHFLLYSFKMRLTTVVFFVAVTLAVVIFFPQKNEANKRKLLKIKKIGALLLLLKGKKRFIFPVPLPLPLPVPVITKKQKVVHTWPEPSWPEPSWPEPESWPEPWPMAEAGW